jgi:hypothetical protein
MDCAPLLLRPSLFTYAQISGLICLRSQDVYPDESHPCESCLLETKPAQASPPRLIYGSLDLPYVVVTVTLHGASVVCQPQIYDLQEVSYFRGLIQDASAANISSLQLTNALSALYQVCGGTF